MIVLLLDGVNFQAASYMAPDVENYVIRPNLQRSMLLRFGVTAGWFLVLGAAQLLWKAVVVHRFFGHPLSNFVDLLFLANTSAVVLDERSSGYYLHGRNQMHHAGEGPWVGSGATASSGGGGGEGGGGGSWPARASLSNFLSHSATTSRAPRAHSVIKPATSICHTRTSNQPPVTPSNQPATNL